MTTKERIAVLEKEMQSLRDRLLIAEAKIATQPIVIHQYPPSSPDPFQPPYKFTCGYFSPPSAQ